jgi:septum formation protein
MAGSRGAPALVLASSSPQRRQILERLGVAFTVRAPHVAECEHGEPVALALENALRKARAARRPGTGEAGLGCDTIVALHGVIYGKPADERGARRTLLALSGATHEVISGLALILRGQERTASALTRVRFRVLDEELIDWYLARGEWPGRAGAYAIQGAGAVLVQALEGDYENVVGLPLAALLELYPELLRS